MRVGVAALALAVVVFFSGAFQTKAFTTVLYPSICLGGWEQPHLAQGEPESLFNAPITELTGARLAPDASAQIFCSRFVGTIPDGSTPREMRLKLYVRSLETPTTPVEMTGDAVLDSAVLIEDGGEVTHDPAVENSRAEDSTEEASETLEGGYIPQEEPVLAEETAPVDAPTEAPPEIPPPAEPVVAPSEPPPVEAEPVSWWRTLIPSAYAAEHEVTEVGAASAEVPPTPGNIAVEEVPVQEGAVVPLSDFDEPEHSDEPQPEHGDEALEPHDPSGEVLGAAIDVAHEPLLEITASFDGITRKVVGRLASADFTTVEFDIPLSGTVTWDDFALFEISVSRLHTLSDQPPVVLDGMSLTVHYDPPADEVLWFVDDGDVGDTEDVSGDEDMGEVPDDASLETESFETVSYATTTPMRGRTLPDITIDTRARHSCRAEPFRVVVDLSSGESVFTVALTPDGAGEYRFTVGSLPQGLEVVLEDGFYERTLSEKERDIPLLASLDGEVQWGDFTLPLLYTKTGDGDSTTLCQVNLSVTTEARYE